MIVDSLILSADGAALVATHAAADLFAPSLRHGPRLSLGAVGPEPGAHHRHGSRPILVLRPLAFATDHQPSGLVPQLDCAVDLVAVLPASARPATGHPLDVVIGQRNLLLGGLSEDGNGDRAGVNPTALLVRRDTLPTMTAGLIAEHMLGALPGHPQGDDSGALVDDVGVKDQSGRRVSRRPRAAHGPSPWRRRHLPPRESQRAWKAV